MNDWYVYLDGQIVGPMSGGELKKLAGEGRVNAETRIRKGAMSDFVTAKQVGGLLDANQADQSVIAPPPIVEPMRSSPSKLAILFIAGTFLALVLGGIGAGAMWLFGTQSQPVERDNLVVMTPTRQMFPPDSPATPGDIDPSTWNSEFDDQPTIQSEPEVASGVSSGISIVPPQVERSREQAEPVEPVQIVSPPAISPPVVNHVATREPRTETQPPPIAPREKVVIVKGPLSKVLTPATRVVTLKANTQAAPNDNIAPTAIPAKEPSKPEFTAEERARWTPVVEKATTFTQFKPFLLNGVPMLGGGGGDLMTPDQRVARAKSAEQIDTLLTWMATPDALTNIEHALKGGATAETRNIALMDFALYEDCIDEFGSPGMMKQFVELRNSNLNQFDKAEQIMKVFRHFEQRMKSLAIDGAVPLSFVEQVEFGGYDQEREAFELVRASLPHMIRKPSRLDLLYIPNDVAPPSHVPMSLSDAKRFAQTAQGKKLLLKIDVRLVRIRSVADRYSSGHADPTANVEVVGYSILSANDLTTPLWQWSPEPSGLIPGGSPVTEGDPNPNALTSKMQRLAADHNLTLLRGYPAVHSDQIGFDPAYDRRFRSLLDRVYLGLNPEAADANFVALHFPETIGKYIDANLNRQRQIEGGRWLGNDQFSRRASEAAFMKDYKQQLEEYAVQLPVRFTEVFTVQPAIWESYDFERGGVLLEVSSNRLRSFSPLSLRSRRITLATRPSSFDTFVPMEAETAKAHFFSRNADNSPALPVMARKVTLHLIDLDDTRDDTHRPVVASYESLAMYKTMRLQEKLADLHLRELPAAVLSANESIVFAGPGQPLEVDAFTFLALQTEATGKSPPADVLNDQLEKFRYAEPSVRGDKLSALNNLPRAERELYLFGTNRPPRGSRQEAEAKLAQARADCDHAMAKAVSPFFPYSDSKNELPTDMKSRLATKWLDWLGQRIDLAERHVYIQGELKIDPDSNKATLKFGQRDSIRPTDWDVSQALIAGGTPAGRVLPMSGIYATNGNRKLATSSKGRFAKPCFVLPYSVEAIAESVPAAIREKIVAEQYSNTAAIDLVLQLGELSYATGEEDDGVILKAKPIGVRVYNSNDRYNRKVILEGQLQSSGSQS